MLRAVASLSAAGAATTALAFVSGPLQARLLGPAGRGELAAVLSVAAIMPFVFGLALNAFVARETARGARLPAILGTTTALAAASGVLSWLLAWPTAAWISHDSPAIFNLTLVIFALLPPVLVGITLLGVNWGRQQFRVLATARFVSQALLVAIYVALALLGAFSVTTATIAVLVIAFVACYPARTALRGARSWTLDRRIAAEALHFGTRGVVGTIAHQGNARLDQVLMAGLVSSRELGHYAVAVTVASAGLVVVNALTVVILPKIAAGSRQTVKVAIRLTLWAAAAGSLVTCILAPAAVPLLFGDDFRASVALVQVLSISTVFAAGSAVLNSAFAGDGKPGEGARSEGLALLVTIPLLLVFLSSLGAMAAAVTSVLAYGVAFAYLLRRARGAFGGSYRDFVLIRPRDVRRVAAVIAPKLAGTVTRVTHRRSG